MVHLFYHIDNISFVDNLKKGSMPSIDKVKLVADYFGVTVDYLISDNGNSEFATRDIEYTKISKFVKADALILSEEEETLVKAYRLRPDLRDTVKKILDIDDEDSVLVFTAARSEDGEPTRVTKIPKKDWLKLVNAPDSPDSLL